MFPPHSRLLLGSVVTVFVLAVVWALSPIRVAISFDRGTKSAQASVNTTATPAPPTSTPVEPTTPPAAPTSPVAIPTTMPVPTSTPDAPVSLDPTITPVPTRPPMRNPDPSPVPTEVVTEVPTTIPATPPTVVPGNPNVRITKNADITSVVPGDRVIFTLLAQNIGAVPARDVVVSDVVPAAFQVVDLHSTKGDIVVDGQTVTAYPSVLEPGERVTLTVVVTVRNGAVAGSHRNTAIITTSTPGDDPSDNSSSITVLVNPPRMNTSQIPPPVLPTHAPARLPRTASTDMPTAATIYGPWIVMGFGLLLLGALVRAGLFRQRQLVVQLPGLNTTSATSVAPRADVLTFDADMLMNAWQHGTSISTLTDQVAHANPMANRLAVSIAVQQVIDAAMKTP